MHSNAGGAAPGQTRLGEAGLVAGCASSPGVRPLLPTASIVPAAAVLEETAINPARHHLPPTARAFRARGALASS